MTFNACHKSFLALSEDVIGPVACNLLAMFEPVTVGFSERFNCRNAEPKYYAPVSVKYYRHDSDPVAASFGYHHKPMMDPGTRQVGSSEIRQYCEVNNA